VRCEACGRWTRRDKAVFIEKRVFSVPLERKEVTEPEAFKRAFFREVAYCPGCGKHLRVYEKKIRQAERERSRAERRPFEGPRKKFRKWRESEAGAEKEKPKVVETKVVSEMSAGSAEFAEPASGGEGGGAGTGGEQEKASEGASGDGQE